jgi:hypothetical protein
MASFGILENREKINAEIAEAKKAVLKQKRIDRELKKVQSGGRVSYFLKKEAEKNEVLSASLELATASDPLSMGQALIRYEKAINEVNVSDELKTENSPKPEIPETGEGGGGAACVGLALYVQSVTTGDPPTTEQQVWIGAGTVNGELPSGFDAANGKNIANSGAGNVWAEININQETGEIVSVAVTGGSSTPPNNDTTYYYTLGYYAYDGDTPTVTNYGCGSLEVRICRNWFAAESPFYGVTVSRCGCGYTL